jgi:hypothetical protein
MNAPTHFIYGLTDPRTEEVRYIGKTSVGMRRPRRHVHKASRGSSLTHKEAWIKGLMDEGLTFGVLVLRVSTPGSLSADERELIEDFRKTGARLTNLTDGGEGISGHRHSLESRARMSRAGLGRKKSPDHVEKIAASHRGRKRPASVGRKISAAKCGKGTRSIISSDGTVYPSIKEAASALGVRPPNISAVLSGSRPSLRGLTFRYATEGR